MKIVSRMENGHIINILGSFKALIEFHPKNKINFVKKTPNSQKKMPILHSGTPIRI